jgi:hypothetical protein
MRKREMKVYMIVKDVEMPERLGVIIEVNGQVVVRFEHSGDVLYHQNEFKFLKRICTPSIFRPFQKNVRRR